jgi:hypothetical protein
MKMLKSSKQCFAWTILVALFGALAGGGLVYLNLEAYLSKRLELSEAVTIMSTVQTLRVLRDNEIQSALDLLETRLNGALITFCSPPPLTKEGAMALAKARQYREKFPFRGSDPVVDDAISKVLSP